MDHLNNLTDEQLWAMIHSDPSALRADGTPFVPPLPPTPQPPPQPQYQYAAQPPPQPQPQPQPAYHQPAQPSPPQPIPSPVSPQPHYGAPPPDSNGYQYYAASPVAQPYAAQPQNGGYQPQYYPQHPQHVQPPQHLQPPQQPQQPQQPTQPMYAPPPQMPTEAGRSVPPVPHRPSPGGTAFPFSYPPPQPQPQPHHPQQQQQPQLGPGGLAPASLSHSRSGSASSGEGSPSAEGSPNGGSPLGLSAGMQSMNPAVAREMAKKTVDLAFCVDCTISMKQWLDFVKAKVVAISLAVKADPRVLRVRLSFVGYRDYVYPSDQRFVLVPFTDNADQFAVAIKDVPALFCSGNDEPEDLLGGLNQCLTKLDWQSKCRIVILITDAPCHGGKEFHDLAENPNNAQYKDPLRADTLLRAMSDRFGIDLTFCRIKADTDRMVGKFKTFYDNPAKRRQLEVIQLNEHVDDFMAKIVKTVTASVNRANK